MSVILFGNTRSLVTPRINDLEGCQRAGARQGDSGGQSMEEEEISSAHWLADKVTACSPPITELRCRHLTGDNEEPPPPLPPPPALPCPAFPPRPL
ncbi:hypothetical protein NHX12_003992 [Muraenolepis orangiensis]|uniref:Uncharacterized protein n=1 Tax=Muraenolepis orangiensis TaxID=630683 RepID=A0A9Q0IDS6_9TELE|nr:hypothetical protein NHX12_003992 [Muraenolepis orangiensis]